MYKNFNLTEEERQQIMEQHKSHGYKKPLSEQSQLAAMKMRDPNFSGKIMRKRHDEADNEPVTRFSYNKPLYKRVYFNNGGNISIQASRTAYSEPRDNMGPYTQMELGYPSGDTVLPESVLKYVEQSALHNDDGSYSGNDPYNSVYPYVPASVVKELIQANGGVKSGELPPMADEPMDDDYESSVENDDYDERQERNYGVED